MICRSLRGWVALGLVVLLGNGCEMSSLTSSLVANVIEDCKGEGKLNAGPSTMKIGEEMVGSRLTCVTFLEAKAHCADLMKTATITKASEGSMSGFNSAVCQIWVQSAVGNGKSLCVECPSSNQSGPAE